MHRVTPHLYRSSFLFSQRVSPLILGSARSDGVFGIRLPGKPSDRPASHRRSSSPIAAPRDHLLDNSQVVRGLGEPRPHRHVALSVSSQEDILACCQRLNCRHATVAPTPCDTPEADRTTMYKLHCVHAARPPRHVALSISTQEGRLASRLPRLTFNSC